MVTHRLLIPIIYSLATMAFSTVAQAVDYTGSFNSSYYDIYYGKANGDIYNDFYFHPKERLIILHGDIATPITLPKAEGFIVSAADYPSATTMPYTLTEAEIVASGLTLATESSDYFYGDFNGDGTGDVIVRGTSNNSIAVQVAGSTGTAFPSVATTFDTSDAPAGYNLSNRSNTFTVSDANHDGVDDLVIYSGGSPSHAYLSGSGSLTFSEGNELKLAVAVTAVGATAGTHDVNADGSAAYHITIAAPEGIAGMQPNIGLDYNSNAGNGHMGIGWSVSGLSSIQRCSTDHDLGGTPDAVDFDNNDQFCLDGMPLVAISGVYGANGTEYRTRMESFSKIVSYGTAGSCVRNGVNVPGPQKFKVWSSNGQIFEYGYTANSRVEAVGCSDVVTWAINKQQDRFNNQVNYSYTENNGEHSINRIDYNGGNSAIQFTYAGRQHNHTSYYAGAPIKLTTLLQNITVFEGTQALREYVLTYDDSSSYVMPRLTQITECAGNECLPATQFNWQPNSTSQAIDYSQRVSSSICYDSEDCDHDNHPTLQYPDINGDSFKDVCYRSDSNGIRCVLGTANGFTGATINTALCANYGYGCGDSVGYYSTIRFVDVNADGLDDLVFRQHDGIRIYHSTGSSFVYKSTLTSICTAGSLDCDFDNYPTLQYPDINGDGLADLCYRGDTGIKCYKGTGTSFTGGIVSTGICANYAISYGGCNHAADYYNAIRFVDVDGDGMSDLVFRSSTGMRVFRSTGNSFVSHFNSTICPVGAANCDADNYNTINYPDINGDGLADLCLRNDTGINCHIGTGYGWNGATISTNICQNGSSSHGVCNDSDNHSTIAFYDLDQDGRDDVFFRSDTGIYALKSTGTGFSYLFSKAICSNSSSSYGVCNDDNNYSTISFTDYNADGLLDLVYRGDQGIQLWPLTVDKDSVLTKVTNGLGVVTQFTYKRLTDSSVYTKGTETLNHPVSNAVYPGKVVSKVQTSDGLGGLNAVSYTYKDLRTHVKGFGSLGFKEMTVTNNDSGITTTTVYSQDYNQRIQGSPLTVTTKTTGGTQLLHTVNNYQLATWGSGDSYRYQLRSNVTTTTERDLNNAFLKKEVTTLSSFDSFGRPAQTTVDLYNQASVLQRRTTIVPQYSDDLSNWFIGRAVRTAVTTHIPGRTDRIKVSSWEYDPTTSRLTKEKIHHPDTDAILHETRYGEDENGVQQVDSFGNNLAITISGPDFTSRTTKAAFDASGRRVISKTNALNFSVTTDYYAVNDSSQGAYPNKPKVVTDANGLKVLTQYDAFGRVKAISSAWGTTAQIDSTTEYRSCDSSCPSYAAYYVVSKSDGSGEGRAYFDKLGRTLRKSSETISVIGGTPTWAHVDYQYDHRGRNTHISEPYFTASAQIFWTVLSFDDLDRTVQTLHPDARRDTVTYNGLLVTSYTDVDGKNQHNIAEQNIHGELIKVTDNATNILSYSYDSHGNLLSTLDPAGNQTSLTYDKLGRKKSMSDPDKGNWSYTYNSLGQLITQTNARGETTCNAYDLLGRQVKRIDNYQGVVSTALAQASEATNQCSGDASNLELATWQYDTAPGAALGKPHKVLGKNGYQDEMIYDSLGRPIEALKTVNGTTYSTSTSYDNLSRPLITTYPGISNRLQIKNTYNSLGMLTEVRDAANNSLYYQVGQVNARGQIISESFGNGVSTNRTYKNTNGRLTDIASFTLASPTRNIQDLQFTYDALGNIDYRQDFRMGFREDFAYDNVNRLTTTTADFGNADIRTTSVTYNALGNILTKTGVGTYRYGNDCVTGYGPHAVCEISGNKNAVYSYDLNGNMTAGDGRTLTYTYFDKPDHIVKGNNITDISYGPTRSRYFRRDDINGKLTEYTYVGGLYEKVDFKDDGVTVNKTEERHYIGGFAVLTIEGRDAQNAGTEKTRYLHKDHIGSVTTITDENGQIDEEFSFDAWGKRRAASLAYIELLHGLWPSLSANQKNNLTTDPLILASGISNKGFTGHEQMDPVGLIHMNGRVYDAELGRFIQADPFVQSPLDLQSYNRFSYVSNNPLSYTDPSGYFSLKKAFKKAFRLSTAVKIYKTWRKYDLTQQLHKKTQNELIRAHFRVHSFISKNNKLVSKADEYLADHRWAQQVVIAVASYYGGAIGAAAASMHIAYVQGASPNQIRRIGTTAYITSYISSYTGNYVNSFATSRIANFAVQRIAGYVIQGASNKGRFGSFSNYMKGWAKGAALNWVIQAGVRAVSGIGSSAGGGLPCKTSRPINIATGEKYLTMTDYQAAGASKLKFIRYYSSYAKETTGFGVGWRSNFDRKLTFTGGKTQPVKIIAIRNEGDPLIFTTTSTQDAWLPAIGKFEALEKTQTGWQLTRTDNVVEHYDHEGRLQSVVELNGYTQTLSYNDQGQLIEVMDSFEQTLTFAYNHKGQLDQLITADGTTTHYRYDRFNNLVKVISPDETPNQLADNPYKQYHYTDVRFVHGITGITNHLGERIHTMAYDEQGRAILSALGDNVEVARIDFDRKNSNTYSTVTNSLGKRTSYTFDDNNKPLKVEGHASASCIAANQGYEYNSDGLVTSKTDWRGTQTQYSYDQRGLETLRIEAVGTAEMRQVKTQWHPQFRLPVAIIESGKTTRLTYDKQGQLIQRTEIDTQSPRTMWQQLVGSYPERSWQYRYNDNNLLESVDGPLRGKADITRFEYDNAGNRNAVINALGHRSEITAFTSQGLPLAVIDANGVKTTLAYNARGWLTHKTLHSAAGEELTQYRYTGASDYTGAGLVKTVTLPNGGELHYEYDSARRLVAEINSAGERIDYTLDLEGNRLAKTITAANGELIQSQRQVFDELSRLLQSIGADATATTYHYDKAGNRTGVVDALGNQTSYAYDGLNRLVATTDAANGLITQTYTGQNQISSVTDQRGLTTRYRYNGFGDKIAQISPDTGETRYRYDLVGNLLEKIDAHKTVTEYQYDVLNRITDIRYPAANEQNIHYDYDTTERAFGIGRLAQANDASGQTDYYYNHRGQITKQQYKVGDTDYSISYDFGDAGQLLAMRYPSGRIVSYQRDKLGRVNSMHMDADDSTQQIAGNVHYLPFGSVKAMEYGNGAYLTIGRDQNALITDIELTGNSANDRLYDVSYSYDDTNNITAIDDAVNVSQSQQFGYDNLYRLTTAQGNYGQIDYDYDAVGNRLARNKTMTSVDESVIKTLTESYRYAQDSNRLLTVASAGSDGHIKQRELSYDAVGNIVADLRDGDERTLHYGANNRLSVVNASVKASYIYNAKGQRVIKRVTGDSSREVHFHYDTFDRLIAETDSLGAPLREYFYGAGQRLALVDYTEEAAGVIYYVLNDHLGTPQLLLDGEQRVVWSANQSPFGEMMVVDSGVEQPLRFPGQYADFESGYSYNYFRDYDPSLGRYIQSDPIGLNGGVNTFGYVLGNPISKVDPLGLAPGDWYGSKRSAAAAALRDANPISIKNGVEFGGQIYRNMFTGKFSYTERYTDWQVASVETTARSIPWYTEAVGTYHTHGNESPDFSYGFPGNIDKLGGNNNFSPNDIDLANERGRDSFLGTPSEGFWHYDAKAKKITKLPNTCGLK